jgi:hypothetical protein
VVELVRDELAGLGASSQRKGAATRFLAGGFLELLTWGLEPGSAADPLELEQLFQRMAGPMLSQLKRP